MLHEQQVGHNYNHMCVYLLHLLYIWVFSQLIDVTDQHAVACRYFLFGKCVFFFCEKLDGWELQVEVVSMSVVMIVSIDLQKIKKL